MIQEKDFLYRVPVKTAPITTPGGQIRNPEILVDIEGGEFMHGNILDANSTNKLINQSVKDAVDNKLIESGCVTKDLLEAEKSARTNGDEDLSTKIQAEQTRAEGKEKEISDKLAIVDGDSNTEGSFRKAIADVIAAAPEDLDTLKEIADKLADSDDLHTALNQAITEKADASALANEVTRATSAESNLQAAIDAKQDAGNYIPYDNTDMSSYKVDRTIKVSGENSYTTLDSGHVGMYNENGNYLSLQCEGIRSNDRVGSFEINPNGININYGNDANTATFGPGSCIFLKNGDPNTLSLNYGGLHCKVSDQNKIDIDPQSINQVTSGGYALSIDQSKIKQVANSYIFDVNTRDGIKFSIPSGTNLSQINPSGLYANTSGTTYAMCNIQHFLDINAGGAQVSLNPNHLFATTSTSSFEINSITGEMKLLSGTSDDDNGLKLSYNGLRIGKKSYINRDNDQLISISVPFHGVTSFFEVSPGYGITLQAGDSKVALGFNGVTLPSGDSNHVLTSFGTTIDITQYAKKNELPTVPTKTSQLTNDSNFISATDVDDDNYTLQRGLKIGNEADGYSTIGKDSITVGNREEGFDIDNTGIRVHGIHTNCSYSIDGVNITNYSKTISIDPDQIVSSADKIISFLIQPNNITLGDINNPNVKISSEGIKFAGKTTKDIPTANGTFVNSDDFASADDAYSLRVNLSGKQNKITVNEVDVTGIETADITKLRTIVTNLINALSASNLIRQTLAIE